jgi:hypothetical protein
MKRLVTAIAGLVLAAATSVQTIAADRATATPPATQ